MRLASPPPCARFWPVWPLLLEPDFPLVAPVLLGTEGMIAAELPRGEAAGIVGSAGSVFAAAGVPQPPYIVLADDELIEPSDEAIRFVESELIRLQKEIKRLSGPQVSRQGMNIVTYLVAGSGWAPTPDLEGGTFPMRYQIDYIRAWQRDAYDTNGLYPQ